MRSAYTENDMDTGIGAAYGTAKSGIGIAGVGVFRGDLIMKVYTPSYLYPSGHG